MLFIRTDDLKPGMRLAKPIYNKLGVMLYDRDTRLTRQGIESIRNFELIGIYILEPAEPVPPLSDEDIAFEQFQTISMFQLRDCMDMIRKGRQPDKLPTLVSSILSQYGRLDHKLNFAQNLRSSADYVYKHSISVAILVAMLTHQLNMPDDFQQTCVTAALLYDFGWLLVPTELAEKTDPLTEEDEKKILACRIKSLDYLNPQTHSIKLSPDALRIITQFITLSAPEEAADPSKIFRSSGTKLLQVADAFDRMTAMSLTNEPISEIVAMKYLQEFPEKYDTKIVRASTFFQEVPV
jgi:HD-GYP domain-containing protein (c-di-GMP phosphodiesterase class II)